MPIKHLKVKCLKVLDAPRKKDTRKDCEMQRCDKCGGTGNKHYPDRDVLPQQCTVCEGTGYENPTPYMSRKYVPIEPKDYAKAVKRLMSNKNFDDLRAAATYIGVTLERLKERLGERQRL